MLKSLGNGFERLMAGPVMEDAQLEAVGVKHRGGGFETRQGNNITSCPHAEHWISLMHSDDIELKGKFAEILYAIAELEKGFTENDQETVNIIAEMIHFRTRPRSLKMIRLFRIIGHDDNPNYPDVFRFFFNSELGKNPAALRRLKQLHGLVKEIMGKTKRDINDVIEETFTEPEDSDLIEKIRSRWRDRDERTTWRKEKAEA